MKHIVFLFLIQVLSIIPLQASGFDSLLKTLSTDSLTTMANKQVGNESGTESKEDSTNQVVSRLSPETKTSPFLAGKFSQSSMLFATSTTTPKVFNEYNTQPEVWSPAKPIGHGVDAKGDLGLQIPVLTVPGLNGLDFPITLSYNSSITAKQPSSWVGLGWNFDPGSITRDVSAMGWGNPESSTEKFFGVDFTSSVSMQPDTYQILGPGVSGTMLKRQALTTINSNNLLQDNVLKGNYQLLNEDRSFLFLNGEPYRVQTYIGENTDGGSFTGDLDFNDIFNDGGVAGRQHYAISSTNQVNFSNHSAIVSGTVISGNTYSVNSKAEYKKMIITATDGKKYVYGLPLFNTFEGQFGAKFIREYYIQNWRLTAILGADYEGPENPLQEGASTKGSWVAFRYKVDNQKSVAPSGSSTIDAVSPFAASYRQVAYLEKVITPTHIAKFTIEDLGLQANYDDPWSSYPDYKLRDIKLYRRNSAVSTDDITLTKIQLVNLLQDVTSGHCSTSCSRNVLNELTFEGESVSDMLPGYKFEYYGSGQVSQEIRPADLDDFGFPAANDLPSPEAYKLKTIVHPSGSVEEFLFESDKVWCNPDYVPTQYWDRLAELCDYSEINLGFGSLQGGFDIAAVGGGGRVKAVRRFESESAYQLSPSNFYSETTYLYGRGFVSGNPEEFIKESYATGAKFFQQINRGQVSVYYDEVTVYNPDNSYTLQKYTTPFTHSHVKCLEEALIPTSYIGGSNQILTYVQGNQHLNWGDLYESSSMTPAISSVEKKVLNTSLSIIGEAFRAVSFPTVRIMAKAPNQIVSEEKIVKNNHLSNPTLQGSSGQWVTNTNYYYDEIGQLRGTETWGTNLPRTLSLTRFAYESSADTLFKRLNILSAVDRQDRFEVIGHSDSYPLSRTYKLLQSAVSTWKYPDVAVTASGEVPKVNANKRVLPDKSYIYVDNNLVFDTQISLFGVVTSSTGTVSYPSYAGRLISWNPSIAFDASNGKWQMKSENVLYDEHSRLTQVKDANGNVTQLIYGTSNDCTPNNSSTLAQLTCVKRSPSPGVELQWQMQYNNVGKLASVKNENGNLIAQYVYDGLGRIKEIRDGQQNVLKSYAYWMARSNHVDVKQQPNWVSSFLHPTGVVTDESNRRESIAFFDGFGRTTMSKSKLPDGRFLYSANEFDVMDRVVRVTKGTPAASTANFQRFVQVLDAANAYYNGQLEGTYYKPNAGGFAYTQTEYDDSGRAIKAFHPGAARNYLEHEYGMERMRDLDGKLLTEGEMALFDMVYDENGLPSMTYTNAQGYKYLQRQFRDVPVSANSPINLSLVVNYSSGGTSTTVDNSAKTAKQQINEMVSGQDFVVPKTQLVLYDASATANENGSTRIYLYQWKKGTTPNLTNPSNSLQLIFPTTQQTQQYRGAFIAYPDMAYRIEVKSGKIPNTIGNASGSIQLNFQRDGKEFVPHDTRFEYDIEGRLLKVYPPNYFTPPAGTLDKNKFVTSYQYNRLGQVIGKTTPDNGTTVFQYDRNGNLRYSQDARQGSECTVHKITTCLTEGGGLRYSFTTYDGANRPLISGELNGTLNGTDPNVVPTSETLVENAISWNCYDLQCLFSGGDTNKMAKIQNFYNGKVPNLLGQLSLSAYRIDGTGTSGLWQLEAYAYDNKGQVSHKSIYTDGAVPDLNLSYGYNILGEVLWSNKQIGTETLYELYEYNVLGQLAHLYSGNVPLNASNKSLYRRSTQSYTPLGQLQQNELNARRPSGSGNYSMRYQYDIRDRLTGINQLEYYATIEHFGAAYTYNATNQITEAKFQNPSTSSSPWTGDHRYIVTYYYDALNRLLQNTHRIVDNSWAINGYPTSKYQERLSYDANGNVLTLERTNENAQVVDNLSMTYKSGTNQLQSVVDAAGANKLYGWDASSSTNQYDLNGNIVSGDGATNISYDVRNLPTSLMKNGKTITYRYNAAGQRIYKRVFGGTTIEEHYVMNGSELVAVIKNGVVSYWKTSYGRYEKSGSGYTAYYYLTDHLGSTRVVLREDGIRTEAYDYYAFGLTLPGRTYGSGTKEKFTGKERDLETGWDYFGARYYNPTIARWMNVDPLADAYPDSSPYTYVLNNPIDYIDPDGMAHDDTNTSNCGIENGKCFKNSSPLEFNAESCWNSGICGANYDGLRNRKGVSDDDCGTTEVCVTANRGGSIFRRVGRWIRGAARNVVEAVRNDPIGSFQTLLDGLGNIPILGAIPDLANAGISLVRAGVAFARGDRRGGMAFLTDGGLSALAAIPGIGDVLGSGKFAAKVGLMAGGGTIAIMMAKGGKTGVIHTGVMDKARHLVESGAFNDIESALEYLYKTTKGMERNKVKATQKGLRIRRNNQN